MIRLGAYFPQNEIGVDLGAVKAFAQAVEDLGYDHIMTFDHVILSTDSRVASDSHVTQSGEARRSYSTIDSFSEVFVLFGCLAAVTKRIELVSGVLVLPQRQAVLVARQAAAADTLSGGRLRIGVGVGWNQLEYKALGASWAERGAMLEEQVALMRALWTKEEVVFNGKWHEVTKAGIHPLPVQRPIPIWFGGSAKRMLERGGRMGDGFLLLSSPDEEGREQIETVRNAARTAGRDPSQLGFDVRIHVGGESRGNRRPARSVEECISDLDKWKPLGITHATLNTRHAQLPSIDAHIEVLRRFKEQASKIA